MAIPRSRWSRPSQTQASQTQAPLRGLVRILRALHRGERGQTMPLMVLAVAMALVGGVLVIDIGLLLDEKRQAQAAADFAALAAAQDLPRSVADPDLAAKIAAAELSAAEYLDWNGYDASDPNVSTNIVTNYAGNIDKIEVRVSRPRPWLIGQIFGLADVDVGGRAVAAANALPRDVAVALDRSGSMCLFSHGGPKSVCDEVTARAGAPGSSPNPLTAAIQAESGDMVIAGATAGQSGSYSAQNGFVVATNQNANSTMTFATVQKLSGGGSETISVQHTNPNRQELVGMTLRRGSADVVQLGGWQTGLDNHNAPAGIDRSLVFIAGWEDGGFPDLNSVRYGGRDLTLVRKGEIPSSGSKVGVEIWMLSAAEIALASNNDFTVNWDEGVSSFRYAHAFFEHTAQTPLGAYEPFDTMRNAAESFVDTFQPVVEGAPFDFVSLVSYNSEALLEQGLTQDYVGAGNALSTALWAMVPATSTNIGHAIAVARMELADHGTPGSVKMIVLLTDGQANRYRTGGTDLAPTFVNCTEPCALADEYALDEATIAAQQGIAIYTIGLTASAGGQLLIDIANIGATLGGGGQFFEVDDPSALSETFDQISELLNYALVE